MKRVDIRLLSGKRLSVLMAVLLCLFMTGDSAQVLSQPLWGQPPTGQQLEEQVPELLSDRQIYSEWVIYITPRLHNQFLNYKDNTLRPISEVRITTKKRDYKTGQWEPRKPYENLWFANGNPVGCRRFQPLPIRPQGSVVMIVEPTKDAPECTKAVANSIIRLLMDIYIAGGILERTYIQRDLCEKLESDLGVLKFYPIEILSTKRTGALLHVVSAPAGFDMYYFHYTN